MNLLDKLAFSIRWLADYLFAKVLNCCAAGKDLV
jgi:hypothetical protein